MFKSILKNLGNGILLGIGAGLSAGLIMTVLSLNMTNSYFTEDLPDKITILNHHEVDHSSSKRRIVGTLKNDFDERLRGIEVKVDFYSKDKLLKQCHTYISTLSAGKKTGFEVSCKKCLDDNNKTVPHDSYKIYINEY